MSNTRRCLQWRTLKRRCNKSICAPAEGEKLGVSTEAVDHKMMKPKGITMSKKAKVYHMDVNRADIKV